jgi:hypothetical protein
MTYTTLCDTNHHRRLSYATYNSDYVASVAGVSVIERHRTLHHFLLLRTCHPSSRRTENVIGDVGFGENLHNQCNECRVLPIEIGAMQ